MIFHVSIEADDPRRVAHALAEIWGGAAFPFPAVAEGSWAALADDRHGSMIEIYPRGTVLREGDDAEGAYGERAEPRRFTSTHIAMGSPLDADAIAAIARREGWTAKYCRRANRFGLIELWVEGCLMVEVLTPEMQQEYLETVTVSNWQRMLEEARLAEAA